jgi:mannose-1-phosphate guanylyltransferase
VNERYALIMAGGGGTRLWPESRADHPKQFIRLLYDSSLLQIAFHRITPLIPPERVLIITGRRYVPLVREQLPELPAENVIAEPSGRNTAPAIGLGTVHLRQRDEDPLLAVLTADHVMEDEEAFREGLAAAFEACRPGRIVTLGITPSGPVTGYGYIERGDRLGEFDGHTAYRVNSFREKPDRATAERFVASGRFYWNSGMFIWHASTVLGEMERQLPELHGSLNEIAGGLGARQEAELIERAWSTVKPISIDYGVMEGAGDVAVVPIDPGWRDLGSWNAVYQEALRKHEQSPGHNVVDRAEHLAVDTEGCLIRSDKLVATVGLRDLVIIETGDAILICPRDRAQDTKTVVNRLEEMGRVEYL